jgi:hypothetical protein
LIKDILLLSQGGDGAFQIPRVPQDDGSDEKIEAEDTIEDRAHVSSQGKNALA